jgi:hypothetical protein
MFKFFSHSLTRFSVFIVVTLACTACGDKQGENDNAAVNSDVKVPREILRSKELQQGKVSTGGISLSPVLPIKESFNGTVSLEAIQHEFDVFSWESFIALNWPAEANGNPDTSVLIGQKSGAMTVWQNYKESRDIFMPKGETPPAWNEPVLPPVECNAGSDKPVLIQVGKTPNVLDESGEPFRTGPLIDQNGQYTRYEILTNEVMFDYIVNNTLYSKQGQQAFGADADFPSSVVPKGIDQTRKIVAGEVGDLNKVSMQGSMMIKAAWKVMGQNDDAALFHTSEAYVYNNPSEFAGVKPACELQNVGLVGFHIGTKTAGSPQWAWSTFEHVNNAPTQGEAAMKPNYNYYNPDCDQGCTEVNSPPARPWDPAIVYTQPSQIERVIPIDAATKALNKEYQGALLAAVPGSVWANYELISTQWPTNADSTTDPTGVPAPSFLANTTLETYIQGSVRQTSSSCIQCHNNAGMTDGHFSDFTYLLQRAE